MVSVFKNTNEWNVFENESKDEIFNSSDNNGFCLEEPENNLMKNRSLTSKWVSKNNLNYH